MLGGNGYVEETPLPRLYRETPVNSIWEGSGNVICLDVLRAVAARARARSTRWLRSLRRRGAAIAALDRHASTLLDARARRTTRRCRAPDAGSRRRSRSRCRRRCWCAMRRLRRRRVLRVAAGATIASPARRSERCREASTRRRSSRGPSRGLNRRRRLAHDPARCARDDDALRGLRLRGVTQSHPIARCAIGLSALTLRIFIAFSSASTDSVCLPALCSASPSARMLLDLGHLRRRTASDSWPAPRRSSPCPAGNGTPRRCRPQASRRRTARFCAS